MGSSSFRRLGDEEKGIGGDISVSKDAFDAPPNKGPINWLRRWKLASLVLNASRRFIYTLDLKKEELKEQATVLFKEVGELVAPGTPARVPEIPSSGYGIGSEQLTALIRDHDFSALQGYGGVDGLSNLLKTNLDNGVLRDDTELSHRRNEFGANTFPRKKGKSFFSFLWEACQDLTLIILIIAAAISFVLGIKTKADIGLSMGVMGTEVAKESSDIIILDDNFASVVKVVRWGRSVSANIQKFIQFQLTVNIAALVINVVAAVSSGVVPLNAVELLWVNLIMDTLGALALATELPTDNLMKRPPVGRRESLITNVMWRNIVLQVFFQVAILLVLHFGGKSLLHLTNETQEHAEKVKNTFIFNTFVFCQIFNEFNARKPDEINVFKGIAKNWLFIGIVGTTFLLQIFIIEFLEKFTSTVRLSLKLWSVSIAMALLSWPIAIAGKCIPVPETPLKDICLSFFRRGRSEHQRLISKLCPLCNYLIIV